MAIVSLAIRLALIFWVLDMMNEMVDSDYKARRLRKHIEFLRKWNERVGQSIITLENEYAELVA